MYINEQYHDLPLLETKEYRFISRDGQLISKQEQISNRFISANMENGQRFI